MKKILTMSSLAAMSLLMTGCGTQPDEDRKKVENKGTVTMTRQKSDSGIGYEIIKPGEGDSPQHGQRVKVHYTGWLDENGKPGVKFDSSVDHGRPFEFTIGVGSVIKGWDEGVLPMKVGEKRRLFIPSALGYGARGAGAHIPPNSDLIFDVELLSIS